MLKLKKWFRPLIILIGLLLNLVVYWRPGAGMHQTMLEVILIQPMALAQIIIGGFIGGAIAISTGFGGFKIASSKYIETFVIRILLQSVALGIPLAAGYLAKEGYRPTLEWSNQSLSLLTTMLPMNDSLFIGYLVASLIDEMMVKEKYEALS